MILSFKSFFGLRVEAVRPLEADPCVLVALSCIAVLLPNSQVSVVGVFIGVAYGFMGRFWMLFKFVPDRIIDLLNLFVLSSLKQSSQFKFRHPFRRINDTQRTFVFATALGD
jgi:hypothetical protein